MESKTERTVIKGLKLVGWQKDLAGVFKNLQPADKLFIKASRQKGKSTALLQILLYVAINRPKSQSFFVSPTNNQNRSRFRDLQKAIAGSPLVTKLNESTFEVVFWNQSSVSFLSAESGDNLRGNTTSRGGILIVDEAAFIKDDVLTSILMPYITVHKSNAIYVSTPRRKSGFFYEGYKKGIEGQPGYKVIDVNNYDNSFFITPEQIEDYRNSYSAEKFKNEILGLFTDAREGVFGDYQSIYLDPDDTNPVSLGIDWSASGTDWTVVTGFNKSKQQCLLWYTRGTDPIERCDQIARLINDLPTVKTIIAEDNSIGDVYISYLKKQLKRPHLLQSFVTTNNSKTNIIESLILAVKKKDITLLRDDNLDYQFSIFEQIPLQKGKYTYAANPKVSNSKDDIVLATAFALYGFQKQNTQYTLSYI